MSGVTVKPMTITGESAAKAADAQQADYFRRALEDARHELLRSIAKRRPLIERRTPASNLHAAIRSAEAELRYVERLIKRLDQRFANDT